MKGITRRWVADDLNSAPWSDSCVLDSAATSPLAIWLEPDGNPLNSTPWTGSMGSFGTVS